MGLLAEYQNKISGTEVSDGERAFLRSILPAIKNEFTLNEALSDVFLERISNKAQAHIQNSLGVRIDFSENLYNELFKPYFTLVKNGNMYFIENEILNNSITGGNGNYTW